MSKVKRQHYVPQFYLKQWHNEKSEEQIYVYNKELRKSFSSNIKGVASSNYYYDFPELDEKQKEELLKNIESDTSINEIEKASLLEFYTKQEIEKSLSNIETINSKIILKVITKLQDIKALPLTYFKKYEFLSFEDILELSFFIGLQYCRTEEMRILNEQLTKIFVKNIADTILKNPDKLKNDSDLINSIGEDTVTSIIENVNNGILTPESYDISIDENYTKINHLHSMFEQTERISDILVHYKWMVCINNTEIPFFTTDNPVLKKANLNHPFYSNGFTSKGIEIFYPISPKYEIIIIEPSYYKEVAPDLFDYTVWELKKENVIHYNDLLTQNATIQIYSNVNNFDWVEKRIKDTPEIANKNRKRIISN